MNRATLLAMALAVGAAFVALATLLLPEGSPAAVLLLDYRADAPLPYPLTIQNLMTLLFALGVGDVLHRRRSARAEAQGVRLGLLPEAQRQVLTPRDVGDIRGRVAQAAARGRTYLTDLIEQCLLQFQSGQSVDDTHQVLASMSDLEMHRVDLRYTLLRYLAWVIPTLGFIGTVVGIAGALAALGAPRGDGGTAGIEQVVGPLSMAFNTTIIALVESAVLVLLLQFTQRAEEEAINGSSAYCLRELINRLHVPR